MGDMRRTPVVLVLLAWPVLAAAEAANHAANIREFSFDPNPVTVAPGDTVTWTNRGQVNHTVTSDDTANLTFRSQTMTPGQAYSHTFPSAGSFPYHCDHHQNMKGTVVVQAGGAATSTTSSSSTTTTTIRRSVSSTTTTTAGSGVTVPADTSDSSTTTSSVGAGDETTTTTGADDDRDDGDTSASAPAGSDSDDDVDLPGGIAALLLLLTAGGALLQTRGSLR